MKRLWIAAGWLLMAGAGGVWGAPPAATASAGVKTDMGTNAPPKEGPRLPEAGGTFVDPVFGTTIMRVTDERDGKDNHLAYSYYPSFNKDATRFYGYVSGEWVCYRFDPEGFKIGEKEIVHGKVTPAGTRRRGEDSIWSGLDANAMYCHDLQRLWRYDFKSGEYTLVKDFKKDLGFGIKQMSRSIDDDVFGFTITDGKGQAGAIAYSVKAGKVLFKDDERDLDEVQVDKSGGYLVIKRNKRGKGVVWVKVADLKTGKVEGLIDTAPDFATGHSDNGMGIMVGADDKVNRFTKRSLGSPHKFISILDMKRDWTNASHISLLADDERWCVISFYEWNKQAPPGPLHSEIVQVATDGSQRVRRLAHHRSVLKGEYWSCPFANISRDGRFIAYGSNVDGKGQRDLFILKVPAMAKGAGR